LIYINALLLRNEFAPSQAAIDAGPNPAGRSLVLNERRRVPAIALILGLALLLRCLLVLTWFVLDGDRLALHYPDTATYLAPAHSLLANGTFERDASPEIIRGPGYPLLLSLGLAVGSVEGVTISLQILLSVATVYLIYRCALTIDPRMKVALLAATLYAIEPLSVMYCCFLLTETLFTFLLVGFLFFLLRFLRDRATSSLCVAGLLLIASAFVRPVSYYLPIVIGGLLLVTTSRDRRVWQPVAWAAGFFLCCALPLGAWQLRNWHLTQYPGFSAIVESDLYFYQQAQVIAALEGRSLEDVQTKLGKFDPEVVFQQHPTWQGLSPGQLHVQMGVEAKQVIASHPLVYAGLHLRSILTALVTPGSGDVMRLTKSFGGRGQPITSTAGESSVIGRVASGGQVRIVVAVALSALAAVYVMVAICGCFQEIPWRFRWTLLAIGGYFWFVSCLPQPPARLRHPLMPILCLLAAHGITALIPRVRNAFSKTQVVNLLKPA
jgi:4-amino-4-deoxy-L-arabinose transferase-like glycosyltransferase